jgi:hypothetical protein
VKKLEENEVEFTVECRPENESIEGNAMASGDEKIDDEANAWVREQLASGNPWAWCTVKITAEWRGYTGVDYLGCCSYKSEEDFKNDCYFEAVKSNALEDLNREVAAFLGAVAERERRVNEARKLSINEASAMYAQTRRSHWPAKAPCPARMDGECERGFGALCPVFTCPECRRPLPWCFGTDDGNPPLCDDCAAKAADQ